MSGNIKKVLITGAGGFIGSNTVKHFVTNGWFVYAMVHNNIPDCISELEGEEQIQVVKGDVTSEASLRNAFSCCKGLDAIVHCAGRASDVGREKEFVRLNYESVKLISQCVLEFDISRLVYISSTDVYGLYDFNGQSENELGFDGKCWNNYPKYKIKSEIWLANNLPPERYSIVRPAAVWGEGDPTLTKRFCDFLAISPWIIHFGKWRGKNRWPAVKVETVADVILLATDNCQLAGTAINAIDDDRLSIDEFYRMLAARYFPERKYRTLVLPFWIGWVIGKVISSISNLLNLDKPFADPSLYALYSVSRNLDFSGEKCQILRQE